MPTSEEIKKLSEAYAEYMCPVGDYYGGVYDDQRNSDLPIYKDDAKSVLEWLSKDYCIVSKSKVKTSFNDIKDNSHGTIFWQSRDDSSIYADINDIEDEFCDLFGAELFNEE